MAKRWWLFLLVVMSLGFASMFCWFWVSRPSEEERLTNLHGAELRASLNHYLAVLNDQATYDDPQRCAIVTINQALDYCILVSKTSPNMGDTREVITLRVLAYEPTCAVTIAKYSTMGSTAMAAFYLIQDMGIWKVASQADVVRNQPDAKLGWICKP